MEKQTNTHPVATTATASDAGRVELSTLPVHAILDELKRRGFGFMVHKDGSTLEDGLSTFALAVQIQRRKECVALVVTPDDLAEYWECDDSGATSPACRMPTEEGWAAMRRAFERWQDCGAYSDLMSSMREAWIAADPESFADDQEGGRR